MSSLPAIAASLAEIGPRLQRIRGKKNISLAALSRQTGISKSTLSRLEHGQRRPSLELLLPIAAALAVPLDEIATPPRVQGAHAPTQTGRVNGRVFLPLSRHRGEPQVHKIIIPAGDVEPRTRIHAGYEWLCVLSGRLRVILGEHDLTLGPGEVAEFDTHTPHWFGSAGLGPVEVLSVFGAHGERMRIRARPGLSGGGGRGRFQAGGPGGPGSAASRSGRGAEPA